MNKKDFVNEMLKAQAKRKRKNDMDFNMYHADACGRMKRLYRGNLIRPSIRVR